MLSHITVLLVLILFWSVESKNHICKSAVCEYTFSVRQLQSMVYIEEIGVPHEEWHRVFMRPDGTTYYYDTDFLEPYDVPWTTVEVPEPEWAEHYMLPMDGVPRRMLAINGQIPGPTIEVMHGAEVVVNFTNEVHGTSMSLHMHGMHQRGTQWMDGAAGATQCPVTLSQMFQYRFIADPPGTHWYHSHEALQTGDGVAGFLVVHETEPLHKNLYDYDEHRIAIQDWYHEDPDDIFLTVDSGFWDDLGNGKEELWVHPRPYEERTAGGAILSGNPYVSGIINGRGRFGSEKDVPYAKFDVAKNKRYRMRFLNTGMAFPYMVSIDEHQMTLLSFCGFDITPIQSDSFVLFPAERFDVMVYATKAISNYWIRARTLESDFTFQSQILSVLHYIGAPNQHWEPPTTKPKKCSDDSPCTIINCPFPYHPYEILSVECISISDLTIATEPADESGNLLRKPPTSEKATVPLDVRLRPPPQKVDHTFFLNWRDPRQVNKVMFQRPPGNVLVDGIPPEFQCPPPDFCAYQTCQCTNIIQVNYGAAVEMVFINQREEIIQNANALHPIHLHGHSFYVVGEGYGEWDEDQQKFGVSGLIQCNNVPCNSAQWKDEGPPLNLVNPPRTDTVLIHPGHFVVVRFYADNPGVWHLHCHIELHGQVGMGILFKTLHSGDPDDPLNWETQMPSDLPTCGSYIPQQSVGPSDPGDVADPSDPSDPGDPSDDGDVLDSQFKEEDIEIGSQTTSFSVSVLVVAVVSAFVCGLSVALLCIYYRRRKLIQQSSPAKQPLIMTGSTATYGSVPQSDIDNH